MRAEYPSLASPRLSLRVQGLLCDLFGWGEATAGISQAIATTAAAKMQADAAKEAAKISADAATHGADLQDAAAQRKEAFDREQADYAAQQQEVDRRANYDQYTANRRYQGSLSQALGLGGMAIPGYVPGVVPHFTNAPAPGAPAGPVAPPVAPPDRPTPSPVSFGAAMTSGAPPSAPPVNPALMAGNTGITGGMATPQLQPDGTYAMVPSMPRYQNFGQSLGAA